MKIINIKNNSNFLLINYSPWMMMLSINLFNMLMNMIFYMNYKFKMLMMMILLINTINMIMWNNNSILMKTIYGYKNFSMNMMMKMSMMMFITSEMMFFMTFFYTYFSNKLFNQMFYKKMYLNIFKLNFFMSFMNLMILLSSSMTMMIFIKMNKKSINNKFMYLTIMLSMYFLSIQYFEYFMMKFNISNSIMFTNFFLLTMFHMMHVIMGTMIMLILLMNKLYFMYNLFIKMMNTCWYWHFIDFIWIMIFMLIY